MGSSQDLKAIKRDICKDVIFEHISTQLLETNLINGEEYQKIKAKETEYEQTAELLEVLSTKGATGHKMFVRILETDYQWIAELVKNNPLLFDAPSPSSSPEISKFASGITQEMIKTVQKNYRVTDNWTTLAHSLGLTKLITNIRIRVMMSGEQNSMCIVHLLQEWKGMHSHEAKLDKLIKVLRVEEFNDIADELEAKYA